VKPTTTLPIWRPQSVAEASDAVLQAAAQGQRLRVQGSGSRPWLRAPAAAASPTADAVLAFEQMRELLWIDAEDRTCCVEAGISLTALDAALAEHGLMLPFFDASLGTLGGALLGGSPSLLASAWGLPRDQVLGATWLLPDGRVVRSGSRVVKSVAGYDVTRLFLGSRGQLAACLNLTVRLRPRPSHWASLVGTSGQLDAPLPSGLWLAVDLAGLGSEGSASRQLRVYSDPLAVPPGLAFEPWTAADLETHALAPIREQLQSVRAWTHGRGDSLTRPLVLDRASNLQAWSTPQSCGWPPPPSPWLAQVQAVVSGRSAPFA
jgi:FAD/FMN-containing dehydrogenase